METGGVNKSIAGSTSFWFDRVHPAPIGLLFGQEVHTGFGLRPRCTTEELQRDKWWERRSDGYYCREHQKKLEHAPISRTAQFASLHGQRLMCTVCRNWMIDLKINVD